MIKGNTLKTLSNIKSAKILDIFSFSVQKYKSLPDIVESDICSHFTDIDSLIVRSNAFQEDQQNFSAAGKYESVLNVKKENLKEAIERVISSYGDDEHPENEVLVQPMLQSVTMSGVLFTICPRSGAPYYIVNYNESGDTTAVTSGRGESQARYIYHEADSINSFKFEKLILLAKELIERFKNPFLDIEFAFNKREELFLFQVRSLHIKKKQVKAPFLKKSLKNIKRKFQSLSLKHPYLYGDRTILGIMPDWNPAEIIGVNPKPLALSLYKELITDGTWAYQRDNYGYRNLRSFPLLIDLCGLPYIDVRVSFNSFLPKGLPEPLAEKLINYYLDQVEKKPNLHDKVEFDIIFSCYTFDLQSRLDTLQDHFFSESDIGILHETLKKLTNNIIHKKEGLWFKRYPKDL